METETQDGQKTNSNSSDEIVEACDQVQLTKRQLKKLNKKLKWELNKPLKRAREREIQKQKKLQARLNNVKLGPSRKTLKDSTMAKSKCSIRVAIDLSLDHLMDDRSMAKCIKQVLRVYSLNRRAENPLQLYLTSFDGRSKQEMVKHDGYQNWDIFFQPEHYENFFDKKDVIYLTSESENVINTFENDKVYIIGGLVDHNSQKGLCHKIALEKGFNHGRLPLDEHLDMKTRKVLTIDHVFSIILGISKSNDWRNVLLEVLPQRKGATAKNNSSDISVDSFPENETNMENSEKNCEENQISETSL